MKEIVDSFVGNLQNTDSLVNAAAKEVGVPISGETGTPDLSKATDQQKAELGLQLRLQNVGRVPTETEVSDRVSQTISSQFPDASQKEIRKLTEETEKRLDRLLSLKGKEKKDLNKQVDKFEQEIDDEIKVLEDRFEQTSKENDLIDPGQDPSRVTESLTELINTRAEEGGDPRSSLRRFFEEISPSARIVQEFFGDDGDPGASQEEFRRVRDSVVDIATNGIEIENEDGVTEKVPVPASAIKTALNQSENSDEVGFALFDIGGGRDSEFRNKLREFIKNNGGIEKAREAEQERAKFFAEKQRLQEEKQRLVSRARVIARNNANALPRNINDTVSTLLKKTDEATRSLAGNDNQQDQDQRAAGRIRQQGQGQPVAR